MGETIFLGYDQAALDREYNNSGKIPNAADYLARYPSESARARETLPARLDLRYGPHPGETLDVFLPEGRGPWPVHVFVARRLLAVARQGRTSASSRADSSPPAC